MLFAATVRETLRPLTPPNLLGPCGDMRRDLVVRFFGFQSLLDLRSEASSVRRVRSKLSEKVDFRRP